MAKRIRNTDLEEVFQRFSAALDREDTRRAGSRKPTWGDPQPAQNGCRPGSAKPHYGSGKSLFTRTKRPGEGWTDARMRAYLDKSWQPQQGYEMRGVKTA